MTINFKSTVGGISADLDQLLIPKQTANSMLGGVTARWGRNESGQVGDGTVVTKSSPVVFAANSVSQVVVSGASSIYNSYGFGGVLTTATITRDGTLWMCGYNQYGQLANNVNYSKSSPVLVSGGGSWSVVSPSYSRTVAIKADGTMWGWGGSGRDLNTTYSYIVAAPVPIGYDQRFVNVKSVGNTNYGLEKTFNSSLYNLYGWGDNTYGQLGDGTTLFRSSPVFIATNVYAGQIWTNGKTTATATSDGFFVWGRNQYGQIGDGTTINKSSPVLISSSIYTVSSIWTKVWFGTDHTVILGSNDYVWAWGRNNVGQLGDGTTINKSSPVQIGTSSWVAVAAGDSHTVFVQGTNIYACGFNQYGQLGDGTTINKSSPVLVGNPGSGYGWRYGLSCGSNHTIALTNSGGLYAWGRNQYGQLGDGTTINRSSPVYVGAGFWNADWNKISTGGDSTAVQDASYHLFAWGRNNYGQLGDGTTIDKSSPVVVYTPDTANNKPLITDHVSISENVLTFDANGRYVTGQNSGGQFLNGTTTNVSTLTAITAPWRVVSNPGAAIRQDGTLWTWGSDYLGRLGWGRSSNGESSRMGQVIQDYNFTTYSDWVSVSTNESYMHAIRADGTMWGWGGNGNGKLGLNSSTSGFSFPTQLMVGRSWKKVSSENGLHSLAIDSTGALWAWGYNYIGQLGDGTTMDGYRSSPAQVGARTDWIDCAVGNYCSYGITSDGAVWAWGKNNSGHLADGTTINRSSPVRIGSSHLWTSLFVGGGGAIG